MQKFNIYQRKDGRFEGRIQAGKSADGSRKYVAFFGQTRKQVEKKWLNIAEIGHPIKQQK